MKVENETEIGMLVTTVLNYLVAQLLRKYTYYPLVFHTHFALSLLDMYKQLSVDELLKLNTNFFSNLKTLYTKQNFQYFQQFMQKTLEDAERAYFFEGNKPSFRVQRQPNN